MGEGRWSTSTMIKSGDQVYVRTMDNGDGDDLNEAVGRRSGSRWPRMTMVVKLRVRGSSPFVSGDLWDVCYGECGP
jgi:hypothetical protein